MIKLEQEGLSFDDVLLTPQRSSIASRFDDSIDLSTEILPGLKLKYPIISSNMDTVTEAKMQKTMYELGGLGIVHRFMDIEKHWYTFFNCFGPRVICIGLGDEELKRLDFFHSKFVENDIKDFYVLIDVAHGHCERMINQIKNVKNKYPDSYIIAGNVATAEGAKDLENAGARCIKVGVGPGAVCSTRVKTGAGVPQLTAISDAADAVDYSTIIADGGIKNSGDIVKAIAAGADAVMIGKLFAGTYESPGDVIKMPGQGKIKVYRGLASKEAQENWKGFATSVEGEMTWVPYTGSVRDVFEELVNGIKSGMSYQNATCLSVLRANAVFIKQSNLGFIESGPHGLHK